MEGVRRGSHHARICAVGEQQGHLSVHWVLDLFKYFTESQNIQAWKGPTRIIDPAPVPAKHPNNPTLFIPAVEFFALLFMVSSPLFISL